MEILNKNDSSSSKKHLLAFLLFFFMIGLAWKLIRQQNVDNDGVYVIAWITETETFKSGYFNSLKYNFKDEEYFVKLRSEGGGGKVGDPYFIKVLPKDPKNIILLESNKVPNCFLNEQMPADGWKQIPVCP